MDVIATVALLYGGTNVLSFRSSKIIVTELQLRYAIPSVPPQYNATLLMFVT
jgi:hypothetical protein